MQILILGFALFFLDASASTGSRKSVFKGKIAGNRTLSECINGGMLSTSDLDMSTTEMIRKSSYPVEEHVVLTEDRYLLTIHRIPGEPGATPVFLNHGMLSSSFDWVLSGKGKALGFLLADRGYDVWMGNTRGNVYSRCHTKYKPTVPKYWDFSWHEMGVYDLPASIEYITNKTEKQIIYVGHSLGTTTSYVMASERPDIAKKVKVIFSFGPIAYLSHAESLLRYFALFAPRMERYMKSQGGLGILDANSFMKQISVNLCNGTLVQRRLCAHLYFPLMGYNTEQFNYDLLPLIASHSPAGTSLKTTVHYCQVEKSDKLQQYDYGPDENLERYGTAEPPEYNISKIEIPVGLFWSQNDYCADPADVKKFSNELPNLILNYKVKHAKFNHMDFVYAIDADKYVYSKFLRVLEHFR